MKHLLILIPVWLLLFSCQSENQEPISMATDYDQYLNVQAIQANNPVGSKEITYWQTRLSNSPQSLSYITQLAGAHSQQFRTNGNILHIHLSDSLYKEALALTPFGKSGPHRALAANAITRHEFAEALYHAEMALKEGDKKSASYYLLFDALMELGRYEEARKTLEQQSGKTAFDYLIRASKLADHDGDLDLAIALMEQALDRKKSNKTLFQWAKSNLGDMYGHAGRIEDAYQAYLQVLAINPNHWRSWQGIAWITFAHDGNTRDAKRILEYVSAQSQDPQIELILAEIAEYEGDTSTSKALKESYYLEASLPRYQGMHNKYLILLEAEDFGMTQEAIIRANEEQEKRPTPQMYDLLAWSYALDGKYKKALKLASMFVEGQTYEPEALYHLGMIYMLNGRKDLARPLLKEALESSFELGPLSTQKIRKALKG